MIINRRYYRSGVGSRDFKKLQRQRQPKRR